MAAQFFRAEAEDLAGGGADVADGKFAVHDAGDVECVFDEHPEILLAFGEGLLGAAAADEEAELQREEFCVLQVQAFIRAERAGGDVDVLVGAVGDGDECGLRRGLPEGGDVLQALRIGLLDADEDGIHGALLEAFLRGGESGDAFDFKVRLGVAGDVGAGEFAEDEVGLVCVGLDEEDGDEVVGGGDADGDERRGRGEFGGDEVVADMAEEFGGDFVFGDEGIHAGGAAHLAPGGAVVDGDDDEAHGGEFLAQFFCGAGAVHDGHFEVKDGEVGVECFGKLQGFAAVLCAADDFQIVLRFEVGAEGAEEFRGVIGDDGADAAAGGSRRDWRGVHGRTVAGVRWEWNRGKPVGG